MSRPIVLAYDGSETSRRAFPLAVELARRTSAPLRVVRAHVYSVPAMETQVPVPYVPDFLSALVEYEKADLARIREELAAEDIEVHADLLELGLVVPQLRDYISQHEAAWVIATSHGRGGFSRIWLGSVTNGLIRESTAPVLVVPVGDDEKSEAPRTVGHVLVALDGSTYAAAVVVPAFALASAFDARVTLFQSVFTETEHEEATAYLQEMAKRLGQRTRAGVAIEVRTSVLPAAKNIVEAARDLGCDMIALGTHGRGFWSRTVIGSVADKVLRTSTVPLLVQRGTE
jgi:nucleotide-binding universal stress UspA family protein